MNTPKTSEHRLIAERRAKLTKLREDGNPFVSISQENSQIKDLINQYNDCDAESLSEKNISVTLSGRLMLMRIMGKASFAQLQDSSGRIQLFVSRDNLPTDVYNQSFKKWDIGDIITASGILFKTKTDELSIRVSQIALLTKSLRPLPEKFHGLTDQETRYRQRYIDLIVNEESKAIFQKRSEIISFVRQFFHKRHFLEVETPMMHPIAGGATAKPFITHHNTLSMDLYLRVAPELYLKRLIVGGFDKVFEINRNFRNEGVSSKHNPEFTMIEFYQTYATYSDFMDLTQLLLKQLCQAVLKTNVVTYGAHQFDFSQPFERLTLVESIVKYNKNIDGQSLTDENAIKAHAKRLQIALQPQWGIGKIQMEIFEKTVENNLIQPTFITHYPAEVSPLARLNDNDPFITDRFEFFVAGKEIANGFSELNDPEEQARRFQQQSDEKQAGDEEAMHYDGDYIKALEYGMPPTAGEGIGIDRLVMLLTNQSSIRDVLLFPHMRAQ